MNSVSISAHQLGFRQGTVP